MRQLRRIACLLVVLVACSVQAQSLPEDSEYVTVHNGHLAVGGERIRLWCVIGGFPNYAGIAPEDDAATRSQKRDRAYADSAALVQRFIDLGFNGIRLWEQPKGGYTKGDGSDSDVLDHFIALAKANGMRIWVPAISVAPFRAEDVGLIDDPASAEAWQAAVREGGDALKIARVWDPRLEAAQVQHMARVTDHVNQHTGLRWGDDPVFAIWELTNEEWWMMKMVGGNWQGLPEFFRDSLSARWHAYLRKKYVDDIGIRAKWGFLLPGESLTTGTIQIAPLANAIEQDVSGMDPQARLQVEAARAAGKQQWNRDDFNKHRGADVIEFFLGMQIEHKNRLRAALKQMGKSAKLGPTVYDTGIGYEIQSQYMHQQADAVAHDAYINGLTDNKMNQRWPWYSGLEEWPRIAQDVPWLEHNRVEGKPYLCYETQIMQPAKYRAEFPLRLLALAAIQDWDAICWHYWGNVPHITGSERPFDRPMDMTVGWHPQGYHYTYDAVQNALMRAAGYAFRSGALKPAPNPTKFIYGRRSLYDPVSMDYGKSYGDNGLRMLPTTYQHGVRIWIDPSREDDAIEGPSQNPLAQALPNRTEPTDQIRFDIGRAGLTFDSPSAIGFAGFFSNFGDTMRFRSGLTLSNVRVHVPAEMPYSEGIAEERYLGFLVATEDGMPLARARRATLALKSTSFNSGFKLLFQEDRLAEGGELPVIEARVSARIESPLLAGMRYRLLDWHMQEIGSGLIGADGVFEYPADQPIWIVELSRS